jgi:virulence-associated protein VapD
MAKCIDKLKIKEKPTIGNDSGYITGYSVLLYNNFTSKNEVENYIDYNSFKEEFNKKYKYDDISNQLLLFSFMTIKNNVYIKCLNCNYLQQTGTPTFIIPEIDFLNFLANINDIVIFKHSNVEEYFMITLTNNFWCHDSIIPLSVLCYSYGLLEDLVYKVKWKLCWYTSRSDKKVYYLPNGDDEFFITGNKQVEKLLKEGKLFMDKNKTYVKGNPKWVLDLELTYFSILAYHIVTCDAEEICLAR